MLLHTCHNAWLVQVRESVEAAQSARQQSHDDLEAERRTHEHRMYKERRRARKERVRGLPTVYREPLSNLSVRR